MEEKKVVRVREERESSERWIRKPRRREKVKRRRKEKERIGRRDEKEHVGRHEGETK